MTRVLVKFGRVIVVASLVARWRGGFAVPFFYGAMAGGRNPWLAGWGVGDTKRGRFIAGGRRAFAAKFSLQAGPLPCIQL